MSLVVHLRGFVSLSSDYITMVFFSDLFVFAAHRPQIGLIFRSRRVSPLLAVDAAVISWSRGFFFFKNFSPRGSLILPRPVTGRWLSFLPPR